MCGIRFTSIRFGSDSAWFDSFQFVSVMIRLTHDPKIQATRNTSYLTASKSLNGRKIARMAPILTIFGPNRSQRRNLFFEKFSNERRRHRGIVVVVIVAVVVAVVAVIGGFGVACIKGTSLRVVCILRLSSFPFSEMQEMHFQRPLT